MRTAQRWTYGVAAAPLVLFVVAVITVEALADSRHLLYDVAANWMLVLAFGSVALVPAMMLAAYGGYCLPQPTRFGQIVATVGLVVLAAPGLLGAADFAVAEITDRPEWPDDGTSWAPRLSAAGEIVFGAPLVLISLAGTYALWKVWTQRAAGVPSSA